MLQKNTSNNYLSLTSSPVQNNTRAGWVQLWEGGCGTWYFASIPLCYQESTFVSELNDMKYAHENGLGILEHALLFIGTH